MLFVLLSVSCISVYSQIYWGYSDNEVANGIGFGQNVTSSAAIYVPADIAKLYAGNKATAVRVGLNNNVNDIKIFITKELGGTPLAEADFGSQKSGILSFNFNEALVLDGEGFYVGYSCTGTNAIGRSDIYDENGCWLKDGDGEWKNYATDPVYKYNALNLAVRIEGTTLPFDARLLVHSETLAAPGEDVDLEVKLENLSKTAIRKYQVKYSVDGVEEGTIEKSVYLQTGLTTKFSVTIPGFSEGGNHTVDLSLLTVNGVEDDYVANNTVQTIVKVSGISFVKRMVVEEGTGTWCGNCPRGIVAFRTMDEKYHDDFIGIAVHYGDDMQIDSYSEVLGFFSGYPECIVNRNTSMIVDPSTSNLENLYTKIKSEKAIAAVSVDANIESSKVNVKTSVQFAMGDANADYRISYVILEDSVSGYFQNNYYSDGSRGEMGGFEDLPSYVSIPFNHVARGIYDYNGIEGSLPSVLSKEELYEHEMVLDLPNVQKTDYLSIVALLINGKTGIIENAAKSKIKTGTGVETVENDSVVIYIDENGTVRCSEDSGKIEVFNVNGLRVPEYGLGRGIYIIRYISESGSVTVKKVVY